MFTDHYKYLKEYFHLAAIHPLYFFVTFITAVIYKTLMIIRPFIAALIIKALTEQNADDTYRFIFIYIIVYVTYRIFYFINSRAFTWNVKYCYSAMQDKIFQKLLSVDDQFTRSINKGQLMNTINTDLLEIGEMNDDITELFTTFAQIVAILIIVAIHSPLAITLFLVSIAFHVYCHNRADRNYNYFWAKTITENDKYSNLLGQIISGLQEVKAFHMLPKLRQKLSVIQNRYDQSYKKQRQASTFRDNDVWILYYVFQFVIYLVLLFSMFKGWFTIDILILIINYYENTYNYVEKYMDASAEIRLINASVRRVNAILCYKNHEQFNFGDLNLDRLSGELVLKNVSLKLQSRTVLDHINLKVKPHEVVAVVGFPGAGKTILFDVLLRLKHPTKGEILLDGINIDEFSPSAYASNVAVANQAPFIFNASIRRNLDFVDPNISHQISACKTAGIHRFIETLPLGYNTILRENATNISGGQRQMISIARTILTDAEVLLLDDISSSLDPDTAKLVPKLLSRLKQKHTVLIITKKPHIMATADRVVVMDHGRIVDCGTHEKLMHRSSLYRSLQNAEVSK